MNRSVNICICCVRCVLAKKIFWVFAKKVFIKKILKRGDTAKTRVFAKRIFRVFAKKFWRLFAISSVTF